IKRRENGAAHEGRTAQAGENGAAEPLHRDATTVDQPRALAVDRQRRLVAEIDALGLQARTDCSAPLALIQSPTSPPPHAPGRLRIPNACSGDVETAENPCANSRHHIRDRDEGVDLKGDGTTPRPSRSINDRVLFLLA